MRNELEGALRALFPPAVALAVWEGEEPPELHPEEASAVARAIPRRVAEFSQGRACARAALAQLGVEPGPLPVGPDRAPRWPPGVVGSITHCNGLVAAVAARADRIAALGLDAEPAGPLPDGTAPYILHRLDPHPTDGSLDKVVFSAKESIFKALHPLTGVWLDFLDVVLDVDEARRSFRAAPAPDADATAAQLTSLSGRYALAGGFVLTAVFLAVPRP